MYSNRLTNSLILKYGRNVMNDFNSSHVKKEVEAETLGNFLEMYAHVTEQSITVVKSSERPDFICARKHGGNVGIELVKIRRSHPNDILWDRLIEKQDYMSIDNTLKMLQEMAAIKDKKRNEPDWLLPESAILLIALTDRPLAEIQRHLTFIDLPDLYSTGFVEVWLVDITGVEAYNSVELFCIQPERWKGYYPRGLLKPYA